MKVLHVTNQFWPSIGGIEKIVLDLCKESRKIGIETAVLCLNHLNKSGTTLSASEKFEGIPIIRIPFLNLHFYKPAIIPLSKIKKYDIVHVHGVSALSDFILTTKWIHKKPVVLSTHGGIFHTPTIPALKKAYFFGLQKLLLREANQIVAVSSIDSELFKKISKKVSIIENGVDLKRLEAVAKKPRKKNIFLFVGRISRNKRINELLNVFAILKERGIDFELRIVGGDWEKILPELQTLAQSLGIQKKVFFLGEISDKKLIEEYGRARFFVSASRYEAFGISTVEAMAAGCVPIVSDIPSFRDFIANTNAGFLVDFTQHSQTADIIEKTLKTDCRPLMKNARLRARDFSWEARIASWKSLYQRVLRK